MSDHDQTTAKAPAQPTPCKMGCGFFGSNATGDCCSKCWKDLQAREKKDTGDEQMSTEQAAPAAVEAAPAPMETETKTEASPMEVEETTPSAPAAPEKKAEEKAASPEPVKTKKKKKKKGYKNLMADMLAGNESSPCDAKNDDQIRKNTGGGAFIKVDKI